MVYLLYDYREWKWMGNTENESGDAFYLYRLRIFKIFKDGFKPCLWFKDLRLDWKFAKLTNISYNHKEALKPPSKNFKYFSLYNQ